VPLPHSLTPLRHRRYAALWSGAFASNIGTWMETVGVGILVQHETGQAGLTGLVAAAGFLPSGIIGPFGGALADRLPRRTLLLATTSVQAVLAGVLTVLAATGAAHPASVTLVVLGSGCAMALGFPAYQSLMPDLVPREDLPAAVALGAVQWNLGRVIGPALAGIVIAAGGYEWAFAVNTVSFLAVILAVAPLRLPPPRPHQGESVVQSIRDGIRFARAEPGIRAVIGYMALNSLLAAPFIALVPAFADEVLHNSHDSTSVLVTAQGLGAVAMALVLANLAKRYGHRPVLLAVLNALPFALTLYAFAPDLALAAVAIFVVGFLYLGCLSGFMTIAQLRAPAELRGRVMSVVMVLLGVLYPVASIVQGTIADEIGLRATTAGAAVLLAIGLWGIRMLRPDYDRHLGDVVDTPAPDTSPSSTGTVPAPHGGRAA
jgi:MFS family permease